ncbi:GNAT family N-acetyltransferase [Jatrophihabitans sp.]|uniref:GNAT family N-acetyltransferase n=1 Tax=Jatrophihabitans sp. TaxID=1932789 RepID=UPI0030C713E4
MRRTANVTSEGRQLYSDVVGDLVDLTPQTAVVASHGALVVIPIANVAIARLVPPSTADELALEEIGARGWQAAETEALGGWLLRANGGFTIRANSVHAVRQPRLPLDEAIDYARAWYAARDLPLRINLPTEGRRLLDAALGERGFEPSPDNHVMVARLDQLHGDALDTTVSGAPDEDWFARYRDGQGADPVSRALLLRHDRLGFATIRRDGAVVAIGRGVIDDGWLGVAAVEVAPQLRRQGLARAVMAALWQWGASQGAERSYLHVASTNPGAVALYASQGYWIHHDYRTRTELTPSAATDC